MGDSPSASETLELGGKFAKNWQASTDDNNLTLHGFRRFKVAHLLNLRFLEDEIDELNDTIYQMGLNLGIDPSPSDRLGLRHAKKDSDAPSPNEAIIRQFVVKLRDLIKQYDDALAAFNNIMAMETFSLIDDEKHASLYRNLSIQERYRTRLVRADLGSRAKVDPFQRRVHNLLRKFQYWKLSRKPENDPESIKSRAEGHQWSYQNTVLVSAIVGRFVVTAITIIFLVVPLAVLSQNVSKQVQLAVISVCIVLFAALVSTMLRISNAELMVVSAAYAAVLSVFISNVPAA
ncbi:MAG: hypothetical protein M1820_006782 [Bogoriella megaspora]|nr:MAG: hypothetical protein M1820_006782 [Bogoriella megaspora]